MEVDVWDTWNGTTHTLYKYNLSQLDCLLKPSLRLSARLRELIPTKAVLIRRRLLLQLGYRQIVSVLCISEDRRRHTFFSASAFSLK